MTDKQIKQLFQKVIQDNDKMKSIDATKYQLYNWRNPDRKNTSIAAMLEVLYKLNHLKFENVVISTTDIHPLKHDQTRTP